MGWYSQMRKALSCTIRPAEVEAGDIAKINIFVGCCQPRAGLRPEETFRHHRRCNQLGGPGFIFLPSDRSEDKELPCCFLTVVL